MPFCIRCSTFNCNNSSGLISVNFAMNSSARVAEDDNCKSGGTAPLEYIPGPGTGTVSFTAYAFEAGQDKWLGSKCKGQAQASQSNIIKYDGKTDRYYLIPTKIHKAQIAGDLGNSVTLDKVFFKGTSADSSNANGATITSELEVWLGAGFHFVGPPMSIDLPDLEPYTINIGSNTTEALISSVNVSVDFPQPAVITYTFEFPLEKED